MDIKLSNQLGRTPSVKEISEALGGEKTGYSTKKISDLRKIYSNAANLDKSVKTDDDSHLEDFIRDDTYVSPKVRLEKEMANQETRKIIQQNLTPDEEIIIFLKRGMRLEASCVEKYLINNYEVREYSYDEIAKILNYTKEKVRQIESKAMRKLKTPAKILTLQKFMNESNEN
jgi:RNA polymerase primary sigma factor